MISFSTLSLVFNGVRMGDVALAALVAIPWIDASAKPSFLERHPAPVRCRSCLVRSSSPDRRRENLRRNFLTAEVESGGTRYEQGERKHAGEKNLYRGS